MEIKINDEIFEFIENAIASHSGVPVNPYLSSETLKFLKLLLFASPSGKIKKKGLAREFISPDDSMSFSISDFVEAGLILIKKSQNGREREFLYIIPELWEKVSLNKVVVREISRQRRAEYRAKTAGKPTGAGAKRWTAKKVKELLEVAEWNASEAAKIAGIKRQYISFLIKKFGIKKTE